MVIGTFLYFHYADWDSSKVGKTDAEIAKVNKQKRKESKVAKTTGYSTAVENTLLGNDDDGGAGSPQSGGNVNYNARAVAQYPDALLKNKYLSFAGINKEGINLIFFYKANTLSAKRQFKLAEELVGKVGDAKICLVPVTKVNTEAYMKFAHADGVYASVVQPEDMFMFVTKDDHYMDVVNKQNNLNKITLQVLVKVYMKVNSYAVN